MDVEYLPFFEDEFFLRATAPDRWNALVQAIKDVRAENDPETNNRGVSGLLALITAASGEQIGDDDLVPILARRFTGDIQKLQNDRGTSALLALENAVETHQWKEDCPSVEECAQRDAFRRNFIEEGKWKDINIAYEHLLQKEVEKDDAVKRSAIRQATRTKYIQAAIVTPFLILLPIGLFLALLVIGLTEKIFDVSFATATVVLFSLQAFAIWKSFTLALSSEEITDVQSTRVMAVVSSLIMCVVSIVISLLRPIPLGSVRVIGSNNCFPLALAQLFVLIVNCSLLADFRTLTSSDTSVK